MQRTVFYTFGILEVKSVKIQELRGLVILFANLMVSLLFCILFLGVLPKVFIYFYGGATLCVVRLLLVKIVYAVIPWARGAVEGASSFLAVCQFLVLVVRWHSFSVVFKTCFVVPWVL